MRRTFTCLSVCPLLAAMAVCASAETPAIDRVEFFIGEDPGYGNATALAIPPGLTRVDSAIEFPAGTLPDQPMVKVTIRAVDTAGNWSPPSPITIIRPSFPEDGAPVISGFEYGIGDSAPMAGVVPENQGVIETEIGLIAATLPGAATETGWVQAASSDGIRGPRIPFLVAPPPVDRFAGQEMEEIGAWSYSVLNGQTVVAGGTVAASGETLAGLDLRSLAPGSGYTLILSPIAANSGLPFPNLATNLHMIADYSWWQRLHFSELEIPDGSISGPGADPTGSGITNLERFVVGLGPQDPPRRLQAGMEMISGDGGFFPLLTLERSRLASFVDLVVEESFDLAGWEEVPAILIDLIQSGDGLEILSLQPESEAPNTRDSLFYRISFSGNNL